MQCAGQTMTASAFPMAGSRNARPRPHRGTGARLQRSQRGKIVGHVRDGADTAGVQRIELRWVEARKLRQRVRGIIRRGSDRRSHSAGRTHWPPGATARWGPAPASTPLASRRSPRRVAGTSCLRLLGEILAERIDVSGSTAPPGWTRSRDRGRPATRGPRRRLASRKHPQLERRRAHVRAARAPGCPPSTSTSSSPASDRDAAQRRAHTQTPSRTKRPRRRSPGPVGSSRNTLARVRNATGQLDRLVQRRTPSGEPRASQGRRIRAYGAVATARSRRRRVPRSDLACDCEIELLVTTMPQSERARW